MDKAKDFEKGFEEYKAKKKQEIEELGQDIYDNCPDLCENGCGGKPCYKCIAEALHRDNYRKIPEGAVVLTRKDREEFNELYRSALQRAEKWEKLCGIKIKETRKETAEKFAERLKTECFDGGIDDKRVSVSFSRLDEICKEITEGK